MLVAHIETDERIISQEVSSGGNFLGYDLSTIIVRSTFGYPTRGYSSLRSMLKSYPTIATIVISDLRSTGPLERLNSDGQTPLADYVDLDHDNKRMTRKNESQRWEI